MIEALRMLGVYTAGRFDIYGLAGPSKASCRAHIMALLLGVPKVTQSKSGVTALRSELYKQLAVEGSCESHCEDNFRTKAKDVLAAAASPLVANGDDKVRPMHRHPVAE